MRACPICNGYYRVPSQFTGFYTCPKCNMVYRDVEEISSFDENYWGEVKDPDGQWRNKANEVKHKQECNIEEIKFLRKEYSEGGRIIDIGAGLGHLLAAFESKWECYGVEISRFCREFIKQHYPFIKIVETKEIDSNYFDVVYSHHVVEHMINPMEEFKEAHRILKPNGHMIVVTPNIESWVARRFGNNFRLLHDKTHINMFGERTLKLALKKSGFNILVVKKPFFKTKYFTLNNLWRLIDTSRVSPPFRGNVIYAYCKKHN